MSDLDIPTASDIEYARMMRGNVPEWGDDYIEQNVPEDILEAMAAKREWKDVDGFTWGYRRVCATKLRSTKENVVIVATKYLGMGLHELKVVRGPSSSIQEMCHSLVY